MNILFIHEIDWLRKVVFEIHTLSELLALNGHRVYAIDYESLWVRDSPFDFGSFKTTTVAGVARAHPGASVSLIRPGFIKIPGLSRLSALFTQYSVIKRVVREKEIDVILLYSIPTNGLQTLRIAGKAGVPVVFRSIDILHQMVPNPALSPVTLSLEKRVYRRADLVLAITPRLSRYVTGLGTDPDRVRMLPLGVDTGAFRPGGDSPELRAKWRLGDGPVIVFIGTLFEFCGLDTVIKGFPEVARSVPGAKLLIVGDGPQREYLQKVIIENNLQDDVIITGFQPYETMPAYINLASICVNAFRITDATRDIFPTKIVQYLACGKPVVATRLPGLEEMVAGEEQGVLYAEPEDFPGELAGLLRSDERREKTGRAALDYVGQTHSYDTIMKQLEAVLCEVSRGKVKR